MTKIFRKNLKSAFTLAEVLITLTIIGVIAAMVIPNLWQRHFEAEMVSKFKKNVSVLSNAIALAVRENGPTDEWGLDDSSVGLYYRSKRVYDYLKPYLKVHKECGKKTGCFATSYKSLFGNDSIDDLDNTPVKCYANCYKFLLEDGTAIHLQSNKSKVVLIDLNGQKGPNRMGVDLFLLNLQDNGLVPNGITYSRLNSNQYACQYGNTTNSYNGFLCGAWIMAKGNMDYLHRDIEGEWKK